VYSAKKKSMEDMRDQFGDLWVSMISGVLTDTPSTC
jgi:hypothetical protein